MSEQTERSEISKHKKTTHIFIHKTKILNTP